MTSMSATRNNHYVPRWYQAGFFEPGQTTLAYLDLTPPQKSCFLMAGPRPAIRLSTGQRRVVFNNVTSTRLSSALWSMTRLSVHLFGDMDAKGAKAIRAFAQTDVGEWHRQFQNLFLYIDVQKIRTPKGLDWLRAQYPTLSQNELMQEMQGIRSMHCTIWAEGVREIISAEDSDVKVHHKRPSCNNLQSCGAA